VQLSILIQRKIDKFNFDCLVEIWQNFPPSKFYAICYSIIINYIVFNYVATKLQYFCCIRYTAVGSESGFVSEAAICAVLLDWPSTNTVMLGALSSTQVSKVEMLGLNGEYCVMPRIKYNLQWFIFYRHPIKVFVSFWWTTSRSSNDLSILGP